ncbi:unnamed protein product, partial [Brassica rapa]
QGSITSTTPNRVTEALLSPDIRFLFGDIVPSVGSACDAMFGDETLSTHGLLRK